MPKIILPVQETYESITRPVVMDIVRQLCDYTGLPSSINIFFPSDIEKGKQLGSSISAKDADDPNMFASNSKLSIDVQETYEKDALLTTAIMRPEQLFIFQDEAIQALIKPAYCSSELTINMRYRAIDRVAANRWKDDIRARVSMERRERIHTVKYHYLVPEEFLYILKEIHRLRENVEGYGDTFDEYLIANSTQRMSQLTNQSGTQFAWGISDTQMRIMGWFDFDGVPEVGSKEDEGDTWTVSFSYKLRYEKPIECVMSYPVMIHNQLLGPKYRFTETADAVSKHMKSYSMSMESYRAFETDFATARYKGHEGIIIPEFDDFAPSDIVADTLRIVTGLVSVDDDDPTYLIQLGVYRNWELKPEVLRFLRSEAQYIAALNQSVFLVSLYRNIDLMERNPLRVDSDLKVYATIDLNKREYHHIRLAMYTDLSTINPAALDRLRNDGEACQAILSAIDPTLWDSDFMPPIMGANYISRVALSRAIDYINRKIINKGDHSTYQFNTVQTLFVQSNRT